MPDLHRLPFYALAGTQDAIYSNASYHIAEMEMSGCCHASSGITMRAGCWRCRRNSSLAKRLQIVVIAGSAGAR
jgi:hypothetical protein